MDTFSIADIEQRITEMEDSKAKCLAKAERLAVDIDALRRSLSILTGAAGAAGNPANAGAKKGLLIQRVREAVAAIDGEFGSEEVAAWIKARFPDFEFDQTSVSGGLRKLLESGLVLQRVEPSGRRPGRYERVTMPGQELLGGETGT